jgi:hypothetical protein
MLSLKKAISANGTSNAAPGGMRAPVHVLSSEIGRIRESAEAAYQVY